MKMNFRATVALGVCAIVSPSFAEKKPAPPPPQDTVVSVPVSVPSLSPVQGTKPSQIKGGLRITIEPDLFTAEAVADPVYKLFQPGFKEVFHIPCTGGGGEMNYYYKSYKPLVKLKPDHLLLHVHIENQMPRVFRGSGSLVQFSINGKSYHINSESYGELLNAVIPPRSSQDFVLVGIEADIIPPHATVAIDFFDVITKIDNAGNILEKQDFQWYYSWELQTTMKDLTLPAESKVCRRHD